MGKRTKTATGRTYALIPRDYWPTIDIRARAPLIPHLPRGVRYAEPMAGNGSLIRILGPEIECAWAADLVPQGEGILVGDVMEAEIGDADMFITNPPWTRWMLHKLLVHLSDRAPTWLLVDADWMNTAQFGRFASRCRRIVYIGRLLWVPGTTNPGFTACCWYLFDKPEPKSTPVFYPRGVLPRFPYKEARPPQSNHLHRQLFEEVDDA